MSASKRSISPEAQKTTGGRSQTNMDNAIEEKTELDKNVANYARVAKLEIGSAEVVCFTGTLLGSGLITRIGQWPRERLQT